MAIRIIANITSPEWGLTKDEEYINADEARKDVFLQIGWARPYDIIDPKGIIVYIPDQAYPVNRIVFKDNAVYRSKSIVNGTAVQNTSTIWVLDEWDLILKGAL